MRDTLRRIWRTLTTDPVTGRAYDPIELLQIATWTAVICAMLVCAAGGFVCLEYRP